MNNLERYGKSLMIVYLDLVFHWNINQTLKVYNLWIYGWPKQLWLAENSTHEVVKRVISSTNSVMISYAPSKASENIVGYAKIQISRPKIPER